MCVFVIVPVFVNKGIKQPPIPPRGCEIFTSHTYVALCRLLGPEQQSLLGCHVLGLSRHMDLRDLPQGKTKKQNAEMKWHDFHA